MSGICNCVKCCVAVLSWGTRNAVTELSVQKGSGIDACMFIFFQADKEQCMTKKESHSFFLFLVHVAFFFWHTWKVFSSVLSFFCDKSGKREQNFWKKVFRDTHCWDFFCFVFGVFFLDELMLARCWVLHPSGCINAMLQASRKYSLQAT